jgi:hypothetical protein
MSRRRIVDALGTETEPGQRMRLMASIFDRIEAAADLDGGALRLIGVPREGWRPFFGGEAPHRDGPVVGGGPFGVGGECSVGEVGGSVGEHAG